jgi:hypothetical protein
VEGSAVRSPEDAKYFIQWVDRIIEDAGARTDYNTDFEKNETMKTLNDARAIYEKML